MSFSILCDHFKSIVACDTFTHTNNHLPSPVVVSLYCNRFLFIEPDIIVGDFRKHFPPILPQYTCKTLYSPMIKKKTHTIYKVACRLLHLVLIALHHCPPLTSLENTTKGSFACIRNAFSI